MTETKQSLTQVLEAAPSGEKTFALMDCALDSIIYPTIKDSGCPIKCLYGEAWQSGLADIAPYLVELDPKAAFSSELLTWDWNGNWGCFVQSNASLDDLSVSLQALTTAQTPDGKEVFFRFQDPRVIRPFLANASPDNIKTLFAKAARIVAPTSDDNALGVGAIVYTQENGALKQTEIPIT